jgi:hypothetical protein
VAVEGKSSTKEHRSHPGQLDAGRSVIVLSVSSNVTAFFSNLGPQVIKLHIGYLDELGRNFFPNISTVWVCEVQIELIEYR